MIIHGKYWENGRQGTISLTPEDADDIWALYNIVTPGDEAESLTVRRVVQESSTGGNNDSHKVKLWMLVRVEKIDVDLKAASLRLNGRNVRENEHVKMGSYHTLDIEPGKKLKISKKEWNSLDLEIIDQSSLNKSQVAACCVQEGLAVFSTINGQGEVRVLDRVEQSIPKKKIGSKMEVATDKFYELVIAKMKELFEINRLKAIILAGPGDFKDELYRRAIDKAVKTGDKQTSSQKSKFLRIQIANAQPNSLKDMINEPRISALLSDTKIAQEVKLVDCLFKSIHSEDSLSIYGLPQVISAAEQGAIKSLLLSDSLYRSTLVKERKKYADLVDTVKQNGGRVHVLAADNEPEKRLATLTGVAAILSFPIFTDQPGITD